jgi:hypothetical protein
VYDAPLNPGEIRLQRFAPPSSREEDAIGLEIRCEIVRATLDEFSAASLTQEGEESYVVLSYVWGSPPKKEKVFFQWNQENHMRRRNPEPTDAGRSGILEVTPNFEVALRHLRNMENGWIWIDAICINQSNSATSEKSRQVE